MPEFLDMFADEIKRNRGRLEGELSRGVSGPLSSDLEHLVDSNWHSLPEIDMNSDAQKMEVPKAIAVDGSRAMRFLAGGSVLYIIRSLAACGG
ncbi:hypothetical protein KEJ39_08695, partial [Candidatus Bathyarchaeota archaeon]|nr:hypothetical protein [Candidatus Bathyarchaeota archaeon]